MDSVKTDLNLDSDPSYTVLELGVWQVLIATADLFPGLLPELPKWATFATSLPHVLRFLSDIYQLGPCLVLLFVSLKLWAGVESVLMLHVSSRLLRTIEVGLIEQRPDTQAIVQAIFVRLLCVICNAVTAWVRDIISPTLETRMKFHFQEHILRAELRIDIPTSSGSSHRSQARAEHAWISFNALCEIFQRLCQLLGQVLFIWRQKTGGTIFIIFALVPTALRYTSSWSDLWMKPSVVYSKNAAYLRLQSLQSMARPKYRGDIVASNIAGWIIAEYQRARKALGFVSDAPHHFQYDTSSTPFPKIIQEIGGDITTLYWAIDVMLHPERFSMSSIALLQQYSTALNTSVIMLLSFLSRFRERVADIKALYEVAHIKNRMIDGDEVYPQPSTDSTKGMGIEVRNLTFSYPGTTSMQSALRDVSFRIPAGSLVVLVGANGSGKSTMIKLLTRMYDADSGEILVDGLPIQRYRLADLRQAQATLAQEHNLYPLTLAENIGLGHPEHVDDLDMVMQAAEDGGAAALLGKFKDGVRTNLEPVVTATGFFLNETKHKTLQAFMSTLERSGEVSGGEKQRLVTSRTFMRFRTGKIKLVSVDEASSALDPTAEHALFEKLRQHGTGKTMIFVTHRFGHLTKHADIILCMKDGQIAESGTHRELMALDGEYAGLYNVQAQAFNDVGVPNLK
ncbi:P-loop containing nucleoside triphosphate hydrolase protein [Mycena rebaudengoi]|nr:P-loop containing nucleoside triphosphate hydrolase protein [Mycena rebaudengoi]